MNEVLKQQHLDYIIDKAEEVFFAKGFAHSNISDIGKAANRSRTTVYSYFESKENLYMAVIYKSFAAFINVLDKVDIRGKNGLEKVLAYGMGYLDFCKQYPKRYQMILDYYTIIRTSQTTEDAFKGSYAERVKKIALRPLNIMIEEITYGQKDGSIVSDLSPATLFVNIWAQLIGITHLSQNVKQQDSFILLDVEVKDWQQNTLRIVRSLLAAK